MKRKMKFAVAALALVILNAACSAQEPSSPQGGSEAKPKVVAGDSAQVEATPPSKEEQEWINREIEKMKEEGILDENGQPAPGVDLNDYPGLG